MRINKTYITIWEILPLCIFIIFPIVMSFSLEAGQVISLDEADPKTDRLLRKMEIIKIPHLASPVDFSLPDINGQQVTLSDFKGKIVFFNFWTTWCPECRIEMPSMEKLHSRFKGQGFAMIAVNLQEPALRVKDFLKKYPLTFTILLDSKGKIGPQFGIRAVPTTFILDKNGGIIGKALGSRHWDSKESMTLFEHLINRVERNTTINEHEQKKSIPSNSVKSDTGTGDSTADPAYTA
jgi:peroxiredoxin